ncbi:MAG: hypothetical protein K0U68_07325 [Gammaproteobacteria bacterium]|nr:hypothetical protein [Gammaproteobacteria bacterium]
MNSFKNKSILCLTYFLVSLSFFARADVDIQPGIGGTWYNPAQNGHGVFINIADSDNGSQIVVSWYHYLNGEQIYVIGSISFASNSQTVTVPVIITSGAQFGDSFNANDVQRTNWGSLTFRFNSCSQGQMDYNSSLSEFGSGTIDLVRLTNTSGAPCSESPVNVNNSDNNGLTVLTGRVFDGVRVVSENLVDKSSILSANSTACHIQVTLENTTSEAKNMIASYNATASGQIIGAATVLTQNSASSFSNIPANQTVVVEGPFASVQSNNNQFDDIDISDICDGNTPDIQNSSLAFLRCDQLDSIKAVSFSEIFAQ